VGRPHANYAPGCLSSRVGYSRLSTEEFPIVMLESGSAQAQAVRFLLDTDPEPGLLPRLLEPFAKRGLLPHRMWSHADPHVMHVEVALEAAPPEAVSLIEGNLGQVVGVRRIFLLREGEVPQAA
jgi:hypothetical protein